MTDVKKIKKLFVFGLGYTGKRAAIEFRAAGFQIGGTCRTEHTAQVAREQLGAQASVYVFDGQSPFDQVAEALENVTHVIMSAPPVAAAADDQDKKGSDPIILHVGDELKKRAGQLEWLAYLSTTGVYGDTLGKWVDETAQLLAPLYDRAQRRVSAEREWQSDKLGPLPVHIFRLPGIYGPGRGPIASVRAGRAKRVVKPGHVFNRIHVDDIVNVLLASATASKQRQQGHQEIYNVTDDLPAPAHEPVAYACELLGVDAPPLVEWDEAQKSMSSMELAFYSGSRLCSNEKIKSRLGVKLRYPTFREGLLAQLKEENANETNK